MVHSEYSKLDILDFSEADRHKFMRGTVIPRPTALVTSLSRDGVLNAVPFSQFVVISVTPPPGFVVNEGEDGHGYGGDGEPSADLLRGFPALCQGSCGSLLPYIVVELRAGEPHRGVPVNFECRLRRRIQFGHQGSHTHLIVGEIIATHCADGVVSGHAWPIRR